jgi:hypothetical protein
LTVRGNERKREKKGLPPGKKKGKKKGDADHFSAAGKMIRVPNGMNLSHISFAQ